MADLKKLGDEIRTLLRQLNGRQKATLVAFAAVILVPLLWLSVRPVDESWLAVQDGRSFEPALLKRAEEALRESGVTDLRVEGERIFVPSKNLALADAALTAASLTKPDTDSVESPASALDIFKSQGTAERESQQQLHKDIERALAAVAGIDAATVISSRSRPTRWNQKPEVAAAVYVTPTGGSRFTAELRNSIFASVARMIPDLVPQKIVVIDQKTGLSWTPDTNTRTSDIRTDFEDQIAEALNEWIPEAEVRVLSVKEVRQPVLTRPGEPSSPVVKSVPNQPGTVIATGGRRVEVDVVLPASTLRSDDTTAKRERIVKDVKRVLPSDCSAVVSFTDRFDPGVAGTTEDDPVADSPVLAWLLLVSVVGSGFATWWFRANRAAVEIPAADRSLEAETASPTVDDSSSEIVATSHEPVPEDTLDTSLPLPQPDDVARPRFEYLQQASPMAVYRLLAGEHPQTMALVLRHLPTKHATDVVSLLPSGIQSEVIRRIAEADLSDGDVVDELEQSLRTRLTSQPAASSADAATTSEQTATPLTPLAQFEQIVELSPENLKRVTEEVEESLWAEALRGSSETLRFRIIASLPPQQARSVRASLHASTPPEADVESTRNRIVETVNSLSLPGNSRPLRHEFVA